MAKMQAIVLCVSIASARSGQFPAAALECAASCTARGFACLGACVATGPLYGVCMAACGVADIACIVRCEQTHPDNCFGDETEVVELVEGEPITKYLRDVQPGALVRTLVGGRVGASRILSNHRVKDRFEFLRFDFGNITSIEVTADHNMIVFSDGVSKLVRASDVKLGDFMVSGEVDLLRITGIQSNVGSYKNVLIVEHGSVLANGLHVTAICDDDYYTSFPNASLALQQWRVDHAVGLVTV